MVVVLLDIRRDILYKPEKDEGSFFSVIISCRCLLKYIHGTSFSVYILVNSIMACYFAILLVNHNNDNNNIVKRERDQYDDIFIDWNMNIMLI